MINIGFDAKRAFANNTGLGNYSRSVIMSLSKCFPQNKYLLYAPQANKNERTAALFQYSNMEIRTPEIPVLKSLWRSRGVVNQLVKDELTIYHGLSNELPIGINKTGIKTVVTIHDLIFLRYPEYYKYIDRKIYDLKFRNACNTADKIIAVSEQTKTDIIQFYGIDSEKINVVYQSCAPIFKKKCDAMELDKVSEKYDLPANYILNVGTIEKRKNALLIVKALTLLPAEISLVLIGQQTPYSKTINAFIEENNLQKRVKIIHKISFEDLPAIYQQASVFVYPSEFEGFGIPILEALYSNIPVIAAKGSCLEEAGGFNSIYIDSNDEKELADRIKSILENDLLNAKMKFEGKKYALQFSEEIHAKKTMDVYESLINLK